MDGRKRLEAAEASYRAYETGDREVLERLLADDFRFFSPVDAGIDRATYFERCWPNHDSIAAFEFERLVQVGPEVFVTYTATRADGTRFRNSEVLTFVGERIARAEVYFGWDVE